MILSMSIMILFFIVDIILLDKIWRYIDRKNITEQEKSKMKTTAIIIDIFVIVPLMIITIMVIILIQTAIKYM